MSVSFQAKVWPTTLAHNHGLSVEHFEFLSSNYQLFFVSECELSNIGVQGIIRLCHMSPQQFAFEAKSSSIGEFVEGQRHKFISGCTIRT